MEFDATGVNAGASPYVTLDIYVEFPWYQSTQARVYGYAGNGTAEVADATKTGVLLGTVGNFTNSSGGTAWRRIVLDRNALSSIMGQSSVVGIVIASDAGTLTLSGGLNNAGSLLTVTGAGNTTETGIISNTGGLTVTNIMGTPKAIATSTLGVSERLRTRTSLPQFATR